MKNKRPREHYQIIITSGTDARKKPVSFSLSKRTIVIIIAVFFLIIAVSLIISFTAFRQISASQKQIEDLSKKIDNQSILLEEYTAQISCLQPSLQDDGSKTLSNPVIKSSVSQDSLKLSGITENQTAKNENSAPSAEQSSGTAALQTEDTAVASVQAVPQSAGEAELSVLGFPAEAEIINAKGPDILVWPFQDPSFSYDTDWPGPDGYYHAPRDGERLHEGVDICAAHETPILAVTDGTVVSNGWNNDGGWMVETRSPEGYIFRYLHLAVQSPLIPGATVEAGSSIVGYCGDTGGDYPNHLHLSIYLPNSAETIDPGPFLSAAEERYLSGE